MGNPLWQTNLLKVDFTEIKFLSNVYQNQKCLPKLNFLYRKPFLTKLILLSVYIMYI
jgi:hypothetical protein